MGYVVAWFRGLGSFIIYTKGIYVCVYVCVFVFVLSQAWATSSKQCLLLCSFTAHHSLAIPVVIIRPIVKIFSSLYCLIHRQTASQHIIDQFKLKSIESCTFSKSKDRGTVWERWILKHFSGQFYPRFLRVEYKNVIMVSLKDRLTVKLTQWSQWSIVLLWAAG